MRSLFFSVLVLALSAPAFALELEAAPTLNVLDLSKKFEDTRINLNTDQTYTAGAVVVIPNPPTANPEEQYMVSIQEHPDAQCAVSGVQTRKNADNTETYYLIIHVIAIPVNGGHCFIGVHMRDKTAMKQAYIDLFNATATQ